MSGTRMFMGVSLESPGVEGGRPAAVSLATEGPRRQETLGASGFDTVAAGGVGWQRSSRPSAWTNRGQRSTHHVWSWSTGADRHLADRPRPLRRRQERLSKRVALAVFSSDALSSVAYATEEILLVLILAGMAAAHLAVPVAVAITGLLAVVAISYQQTIHAYPSGGGSYIVARANL